jgi:hypothetical protein
VTLKEAKLSGSFEKEGYGARYGHFFK